MIKTFASKALSVIKNHRAWLIGAAVLAASHTAMYGAGYLHAERKAAAEQVLKAEQRGNAQVAAVVKQETKAQAERIEVKVRDIKREQQLAAQIETLRAERDALKEAIYENPDPAADFVVGPGYLSLLNDAARGGDSRATSGVSGAPGFAAGQEQAPASLPLRDVVAFEADIRFQYRELATRHDALVDWVYRELIDPQVANAEAVDAPARR